MVEKISEKKGGWSDFGVGKTEGQIREDGKTQVG